MSRTSNLITDDPIDNIINAYVSGNDPTSINRTPNPLPKRLRSLDTLRGFSLIVMVFVNYGS